MPTAFELTGCYYATHHEEQTIKISFMNCVVHTIVLVLGTIIYLPITIPELFGTQL